MYLLVLQLWGSRGGVIPVRYAGTVLYRYAYGGYGCASTGGVTIHIAYMIGTPTARVRRG
eukprot:SAG31_NODE_24557_length_479_cov_0.602632_1_plen_59_part_01